jgi:WhiB family redox-sensing transcriptional regulator
MTASAQIDRDYRPLRPTLRSRLGGTMRWEYRTESETDMAPNTRVVTMPTPRARQVGKQLVSNPECTEEINLYDRLMNPQPKPADIALGQAICLNCPSRTACLDLATESRVSTGMYGGKLIQRTDVAGRSRP